MRRDRRSRCATAVYVVVRMSLALSAHAAFLPGRGNPHSECYVGVEVEGRMEGRGEDGSVTFHPIAVAKGGTRVVQESCADECEFNVMLCADFALAGCKPTPLREIFVIGDTEGKALERPVMGRAVSDCSNHLEPLTLKLGTRRRVTRRLTFLAQGAGRRRDWDTVTLVCERSARICCGDGIVSAGEQCDDGNTDDGDGCDSNCTPTGCGNGVRTGTEECDDGNRTSGDGCDANCTAPRCGNGIVGKDKGGRPEACEPGAGEACGCGFFCNAQCQCEDRTPCNCFGPNGATLPDDNLLTFKNEDGALRRCGTVTGEGGTELNCGGLYLGGGPTTIIPQPVGVDPDLALTVAATCIGDKLVLSGAHAALGCTEPGCLFGRPIPIDVGVPTCMMVSLSGVASGAVDCTTWDVTLNVPLQAEVFGSDCLTCPACPACPPDATHATDCSTDTLTRIATVRLPDLTFTTRAGVATRSAPDGRFCGFCRQQDGCFEGDPHSGCVPFGSGAAVPCSDAEPCIDPNFPVCEQQRPGAFGFGEARRVDETGKSPVNLGDGGTAEAELAGVFCIPPTFAPDVAGLDDSVSFPGPAALGLAGRFQLSPAPPSPPRCP